MVLLAAQIVGGVLLYTQKTEVTEAWRSQVPPSFSSGVFYITSTLRLFIMVSGFLITLDRFPQINRYEADISNTVMSKNLGIFFHSFKSVGPVA